MNKIIVVIVIAVIIGIGVTASSMSMEKTADNTENSIILDEIIPVEEEPKETGRALTVELTESIGLKTP